MPAKIVTCLVSKSNLETQRSTHALRRSHTLDTDKRNQNMSSSSAKAPPTTQEILDKSLKRALGGGAAGAAAMGINVVTLM